PAVRSAWALLHDPALEGLCRRPHAHPGPAARRPRGAARDGRRRLADAGAETPREGLARRGESGLGDAELVEQRAHVQRVEAEPVGDLFARGPRSLAEELAQEVSR